MFDRFQELEKEIEVEKIRARGVQVWPILRIYIASQLVFDQDRSVRLSSSILRSALRYFFYGLPDFFGKTDYLFFSSSDQRKKIGDVFIDRADIVSEILPHTLIVELASNGMHRPKRECPDGRLMSKFPFYAKTSFFSFFVFGLRLEGRAELKRIMDESGVHIPYKKYIRRFFANKWIMSFLIRWKGLKGLLLTTPYTNMGYVYAFRTRGLPVVEFQHGTISSSHYAYNLNKEFDRRLFPSALLTFGRREADVFHDDNHYISRENVRPVGSFVIDEIMKKPPVDKAFDELTAGYARKVAFTAQDALEEQFIPFLKECAEKDSDTAYILIPRFRTVKYYEAYQFPSNVLYVPWLTTYEIMYLCDFHSTINSTTALEAPSLGTVNILANVENRARDYFEGFIDSELCHFADRPEDYIKILRSLPKMDKQKSASMNSDLFVPDFRSNVGKVLKKLF